MPERFCKVCNISYFDECHCCKAVHDHKSSIELEGGWVLNHWGAKDEKYLGRLVIQTKAHRLSWDKLIGRELSQLGKNIKNINECLMKYYRKKYSDTVEQVYAVYFNDSPYKTKKLNLKDINSKLHVHIHLLTRSKKMREALRCNVNNLGWKFIDCIGCFPEDYQITGKDDPKVEKLMEYLRNSLTNVN